MNPSVRMRQPDPTSSLPRTFRSLAAIAALVVLPGAGDAAGSDGPSLPDSVLVRMEGRPAITIAGFLREWRRAGPAAGTDSLTPEAARRFLDLLIDRELLTRAALRETWAWSPEDSSEYRALRDRVTLQAALARALGAARATFGGEADDETRGMAARDSAMARAAVTFDEALVARVTSIWKALPPPVPGAPVSEQLKALQAVPAIDSTDLSRPLAHSRVGDYRVSELLSAWTRLGPAYRPRIEAESQIRDLVRNGLFERTLRAEAARGDFDSRPEIVSILAAERERIAARHYVAREITGRIPLDSLTLFRFHREHPDDWTLPERTRLLRLSTGSKADAHRLAATLRDEAAAESLAARAARRGVRYVVEVTAAADSAAFAAARRAGPGAVLGPEEADGEWWVARVLAVVLARHRRFDEVRDQVASRWASREAERRTRELCDRLRRSARIRINEPALERLGTLAGRR